MNVIEFILAVIGSITVLGISGVLLQIAAEDWDEKRRLPRRTKLLEKAKRAEDQAAWLKSEAAKL